MTFSSLFTGSSSLSVFARGVLYFTKKKAIAQRAPLRSDFSPIALRVNDVQLACLAFKRVVRRRCYNFLYLDTIDESEKVVKCAVAQ